MKFAVPFFNKDGGGWMKSADEIILKYTEHTQQSIIDILEEYKDYRIIFNIVDFVNFNKDIVKLYELLEIYNDKGLKNWSAKISLYGEDVLLAENWLKSNIPEGKEFPHFYSFAAENFEQLDRLLYLPVTDLYVTNYLAFDMVRVKERVDRSEYHPKIRIYPNVCQSFWQDTISIKTFFVRPEDVGCYERYVDVMEIYATTIDQLKIADVYYDIYHHNKGWYGDLQEYLINCNQSIPNQYIYKDFGEMRLRCQQKCMQNKCNFCISQWNYIKLVDKTMQKIGEIDEKIDTNNLRIPVEEEVESIYEYISEPAE